MRRSLTARLNVGPRESYFFSVAIPQLVGKGRLELPRLAAHDPKSCSSTNSDTPPEIRGFNHTDSIGDPPRDRTGNLRIKSPLLCQLS